VHKRIFTPAGQVALEKISGDSDPLQVDPIAAHRFLFGRAVLHGIHLLLSAVDDYVRDTIAPLALRSIKVRFLRPVAVNEAVHWSVLAKQESPQAGCILNPASISRAYRARRKLSRRAIQNCFTSTGGKWKFGLAPTSARWRMSKRGASGTNWL